MGNIHNQIFRLGNNDIGIIKASFDDKTHVVEIDGSRIQTWKDYITEIQSKFEFPSSCEDSVDRYLDWMRDLDWLKKEAYVLIINNYDSFIKNDLILKKQIVDDFKEIILPFWESEVEEVVVDGKAKSFRVFLVD